MGKQKILVIVIGAVIVAIVGLFFYFKWTSAPDIPDTAKKKEKRIYPLSKSYSGKLLFNKLTQVAVKVSFQDYFPDDDNQKAIRIVGKDIDILAAYSPRKIPDNVEAIVGLPATIKQLAGKQNDNQRLVVIITRIDNEQKVVRGEVMNGSRLVAKLVFDLKE